MRSHADETVLTGRETDQPRDDSESCARDRHRRRRAGAVLCRRPDVVAARPLRRRRRQRRSDRVRGRRGALLCLSLDCTRARHTGRSAAEAGLTNSCTNITSPLSNT